jgi:hypothetical protein
MRRINLKTATILTLVTLTAGLATLLFGGRVASCEQSDEPTDPRSLRPDECTSGPFPSDRFTVADSSQNTGCGSTSQARL